MRFHRRHVLASLVLGAAAPALWAGAYEDFFVAILRDDADAITALLRRGLTRIRGIRRVRLALRLPCRTGLTKHLPRCSLLRRSMWTHAMQRMRAP